MGRRKKGDGGSGGGNSFTALFLSLMILLLALFIVLTAKSSFEKERIEKALQSLGTGFGLFGLGVGSEPVSKDSLGTRPALELVNQIKDTLDRSIISANKENDVQLFEDERRLVISIKEGALFEAGSGAIHPRLFLLLDNMGELAQSIGIPLNVEGHTDAIPGSDVGNWRLSALRAAQVRNYLVNAVGMNPTMVSAEGYGQYHPIAENDTEENRMRNRRVELVFYKKDIQSLESL